MIEGVDKRLVGQEQENTLNSTIVLDFLLEIDKAETIQDCFAALTRAVERLGLAGVAYTSIPVGLELKDDIAPVFLSSVDFDKGFLNHYEQAGLASQDFTIKRISEGDTQIMDWRAEEKSGSLSESETEVIQVAREEYRINNALSIPTMSSRHCLSGASVICEDTDDAFDKFKRERLEILSMLIRVFHDKVHANIHLKKHFYLNIIDGLTETEKKVLKFICTGQPLKRSEDFCGVSSSYAGNVRKLLYDKLNLNNSAELAYVIGLHELIDML